MLWLFLYAAAFMDLNLEMKSNATDRCEGIKDISSDCSKSKIFTVKAYLLDIVTLLMVKTICLHGEVLITFVVKFRVSSLVDCHGTAYHNMLSQGAVPVCRPTQSVLEF